VRAEKHFERSMGMAGPGAALVYYWYHQEVPSAWIGFTWLGFSLFLMLLSLRRD